MTRINRLVVLVVCALSVAVSRVGADELWIAPTSQQDVGGLQIASNAFWPVTPISAVRFAFAIPNNLQTFQNAKVVLIPHAPGGAATLNVFICPAQNGGAVIGSCAGPFAQGFTGVTNQLAEVDVTAIIAPRIGTPGATYLAVLAYTTPTTTTDHVVGLRFGYEPIQPANVATLGANTFTGTQTAPAFVGDGSGLTNLPTPNNVATLGSNTFSGTQTAPAFVGDGSGLTNLPVPGGVATLGANTFGGIQTAPGFVGDGSSLTNVAKLGANVFGGTQSISGGNLDLGDSMSTGGNITKNGDLFLHNYGTGNTFLGVETGNLTMNFNGAHNTAIGFNAFQSNTTGQENTAIGSQTLVNNTSGILNTAVGAGTMYWNTTGSLNTATGRAALQNNTTGDSNTANGWEALYSNITGSANTATGTSALEVNYNGSGNTANGMSALQYNTTGNGNTANGVFALINNGAGENNVAVGYGAGYFNQDGSNNIYLGANVSGYGESNVIRLGLEGTQTMTFIAGVRGITPINADAVPVVIDSAGQLGTVSPTGLATLGANTFSGTQTAPAFAGDGSALTNLPVPNGVATLGANTFSGTQSAPGFIGNGSGMTNVNADLLDGLNSTAFASAVHGHDVAQVTNAARLAGGNMFTGTQTLDAGNLDLDPSTASTGLITKNGTRFLHNYGGSSNTFLGMEAGNFTTTGSENTASGGTALQNITTGGSNTATGFRALRANTTGFSNTAGGFQALLNNFDGSDNTAIGVSSLFSNFSGTRNVAVGWAAGIHNTGSNNIYLGANTQGTSSESNAMYLGVQGQQTKTIIAGIRGIVTGVANAIPVVIDSNGQLGTVSSSRRFKEDIRDMSDASRRLYRLRPVTFRYTQAYQDGSKPINYGLVAEEVAEVFPELAVRSADGEIETVHYETLNVLLLNEVQKQQQRIEALEQQLTQMLKMLERR